MYSCCWKNKLSETQHLIWVSRTVKTDCTTDVYGSTCLWGTGDPLKITIRVFTHFAM